MRTIGGVLLGIFLFFPGIVLLQWLAVNVLGVYDSITLTDGCLVMIIILLCVHLVRGRPAPAAARQRKTSQVRDYIGDPQPEYLPGNDPKSRRSRTGRPTRTNSRRPRQ
ncbi:MAG: hypothetical protein ABFE07_05300 [Armatimonadia bacterium]